MIQLLSAALIRIISGVYHTVRSFMAGQDTPVKVYILLGQSNMLGMGAVGDKDSGDGSLYYACHEKGLYKYLLDNTGNNWNTRQDVRYVFSMGSALDEGKLLHNEWMTVAGERIGPELGIGHEVGNNSTVPVLLLKACIGNRSLGWDLLPPGSKEFEFTGADGVTWVHPGYKGSPERWKKGEEPKPIDWYAGIQYDGDISRAKGVLSDISKYVPGAKRYEIAGFFWWQGDKDSRSEALSCHYEENLVHIIRQLRDEFDAPKANFVCATLGQTPMDCDQDSCCGKVFHAMMDVCSDKYPEFQGNVQTVYTHPLSKGGSSGSHYDHNAETYMNVGEAMGKAMADLETQN